MAILENTLPSSVEMWSLFCSNPRAVSFSIVRVRSCAVGRLRATVSEVRGDTDRRTEETGHMDTQSGDGMPPCRRASPPNHSALPGMNTRNTVSQQLQQKLLTGFDTSQSGRDYKTATCTQEVAMAGRSGLASSRSRAPPICTLTRARLSARKPASVCSARMRH